MKTGYFKSIINGHIKCVDGDKKIFFEQGSMGRRGFVIPDEYTELLLHKKIKNFYITLIVLSGVLGGCASSFMQNINLIGFVIFLVGVTVLSLFGTRLYFHNITKNLESRNIKNSPTARWAEMGNILSPSLLYLFSTIVLLFVILSVWLYTKTHNPILLISGVVFALLLIPYGIAIRNKIKKKT